MSTYLRQKYLAFDVKKSNERVTTSAIVAEIKRQKNNLIFLDKYLQMSETAYVRWYIRHTIKVPIIGELQNLFSLLMLLT